MSKRVQTYGKSPYVGTFQYPNAGPNHIHIKPNKYLLPANIPFIGTFRHNMPLFLPTFLRTQTRDFATQTEHSSKSSKNNIHQETQTEGVNLDTFVIVKYQPDDTTDL
tara:strand:- start:375 stop:698 length:324 start_codon:yes stop_codon:yes gene_type:complete